MKPGDVFQILKKIPRGKVTTYKHLAKAVGSRPRAIGKMLNSNKNSDYPCYKVVKSDGSLGGYNSGIERKKELLEREGIRVEKGKIDLGEYFFAPKNK